MNAEHETREERRAAAIERIAQSRYRRTIAHAEKWDDETAAWVLQHCREHAAEDVDASGLLDEIEQWQEAATYERDQKRQMQSERNAAIIELERLRGLLDDEYEQVGDEHGPWICDYHGGVDFCASMKPASERVPVFRKVSNTGEPK